jgi:hydrogenase maturation protease
MPSIAVLGLGNTLMRDDGVGARVLDELARRFRLPPMVALIKSDAPMARLAAELEGVGHLIVVDAVRGGRAPGTVYDMGRSGREQLASAGRSACSSHGMGLAELLALLTALGRCPEIRIIGVEIGVVEIGVVEIGGVEIGGVEAGKLNDAGLELSGPVEAALPRAVDAVVEELRRLGIPVEERAAVRSHA